VTDFPQGERLLQGQICLRDGDCYRDRFTLGSEAVTGIDLP
jgi:hypothetical protein